MIYIKQFLTWLMDEEDTFIFEETTVPPIYSKGDTGNRVCQETSLL